ncbi:hypothetical protein KAJ83_05455 [Marivibrio halodurans]|uniref:Uncharacterized protein n=1 Tax=Marivibrio halodurans TaxID=2039722 RepID=A0A8J7V348_9PROT|nr:hypothetical protein [Marivibrio halodurans]MBP5856444.1 hypothetical protein [Marivibrio halodurans]
MTEGDRTMTGNGGDRVGMGAARFAALAEAYGASIARWPAAERGPARDFRAAAPAEAARLLAEAATLDRMLDEWAAPDMPANLAPRLAGHARPGTAARLRRLLQWPGPIWQPAGAFAAALMLGLGLGVGAPDMAPLGGLVSAETPTATPPESNGIAMDETGEGVDIALFLYGPAAPDAGVSQEGMQ